MDHHATTTHVHRPLAARLRLLAGALALSAAAMLADPAHAQFGGRASFAEAFQADILPRDLPLMVQVLGLEEWQRPIVETLMDDYNVNFNAGVEGAKQRMQAASEEGAKATPGNGDAILRKVMDVLASWREEKHRLVDKFVEDLRSQLGPQQMERWPAFERALRRERDLPDGDISGESVNLWTVLSRMQPTPAEQEAIKPVLDAYEVKLDDALLNRRRKMAQYEGELRDAMTTMDFERGAGVQDRIMVLRVQVRSANDEGIDSIAAALGARGPEFRRLALEAGYPDAYRTHPLSALFDSVLKMDTLTAEQVAQINTLRGGFDTACAEMNAKFYEVLRAEEPKEPRRKVQAMIDRRAGEARSAPSTPQGANQADPIVRIRADRDRMGNQYREQLMAILTPEQQAQIPGMAKYEGAPRVKEAGEETGDKQPEDPAEAKRKADKRSATGERRDPRQMGGSSKGRDRTSTPLPNEAK